MPAVNTPCFFSVDVVLGDEQVLTVVASGPCRKFRAQLMHETREITRHDQNLLGRAALHPFLGVLAGQSLAK